MPIKKSSTKSEVSIWLMLKLILILLLMSSLETVEARSSCKRISLENGNIPSDMDLTIVTEDSRLRVFPLSCSEASYDAKQCLIDRRRWHEFAIKESSTQLRSKMDEQRLRAQRHAERFVSSLEIKVDGLLAITPDQQTIFDEASRHMAKFILNMESLKEARKTGMGNCAEQTFLAGIHYLVKYGRQRAHRLQVVHSQDRDGVFHTYLHVKPRSSQKKSIALDSLGDISPLEKLDGLIIDLWNNNLVMPAADARAKYPLLYASPTAKIDIQDFPFSPPPIISELPGALQDYIKGVYRRYNFKKLTCIAEPGPGPGPGPKRDKVAFFFTTKPKEESATLDADELARPVYK